MLLAWLCLDAANTCLVATSADSNTSRIDASLINAQNGTPQCVSQGLVHVHTPDLMASSNHCLCDEIELANLLTPEAFLQELRMSHVFRIQSSAPEMSTCACHGYTSQTFIDTQEVHAGVMLPLRLSQVHLQWRKGAAPNF